jgi:hypothetical protein
MERVVINLITYGTGGNQSHNLWNRWESISQLIEWVVINLTTNRMDGNHDYHPFNKLCD